MELQPNENDENVPPDADDEQPLKSLRRRLMDEAPFAPDTALHQGERCPAGSPSVPGVARTSHACTDGREEAGGGRQ